MYEFLIRDVDGRKRQERVRAREVVIGRKEGADLVLADRSVSGKHARVSAGRGGVCIEDLGSANGIFVNGERIEGKAVVGPTDLITLGNFQLWVRPAQAAAAGAAAAKGGRPAKRAPPETPAAPVPSPGPDDFDVDPADLPEYGREEEPADEDDDELPCEDQDQDQKTVRIAPPAPEAKRSQKQPPKQAAQEPVEPAEAGKQDLSDSANYQRQVSEFYSYITIFLEPVKAYLEDSRVQEIMINGADQIFIERGGRIQLTPARFAGEDQLRAAVANIAKYVGRPFDELHPVLDARLPDGSRVHSVCPPCSRRGTIVAIRKFQAAELSLERLVELGALSQAALQFLEVAVLLRKNIIIAGGTGSGKTSLLNAVSSLIPPSERIVVIEDSSELQLQQAHVLPLETRPPDKHGQGEVSMRDLLKSSLRLRPDRIIFGEVRGGEALDLLQAFNTGHSGSMATIHANSAMETMYRLETLTLYSGLELPIKAIKDQVSSAIDLVIQTGRFFDGSRRVTQLTEILGLEENGAYQLADIFRFDRRRSGDPGKVVGSLDPTGERPSFLDEAEKSGFQLPRELFEKPRRGR